MDKIIGKRAESDKMSRTRTKLKEDPNLLPT